MGARVVSKKHRSYKSKYIKELYDEGANPLQTELHVSGTNTRFNPEDIRTFFVDYGINKLDYKIGEMEDEYKEECC